MRTPIEALKEIRDRLTYFCLRTDGKYDPPWATELVGIIDEAVTDSHAIGNAAAMREALVEAIGETCAGCKRDCDDCMNLKSGWMKKAKAALSAPPRNCDVGTAEEQAERHSRFCISQHGLCTRCPAHRRTHNGCVLAWAQMPYEAQEGAGE